MKLLVVKLSILAVFAVAFGWLGIPEDFLGLHIWPKNFFHGVAYSLHHAPKAPQFSWIPLTLSLVVALGGLGLGWLVYRNFKVGDEDPVKKLLGPVYKALKNKYYFDEFYDAVFVKPLAWFSETFSYLWMDRKIIDGFRTILQTPNICKTCISS